MTSGPALPCPACKRTFGALDWIDSNRCTCRYCREDFDFVPFPALTRTREVAKPQAVAVAEDSTCFFHAQNQAEKVCDGCGRFLCAVCAVPLGGRTICPSCISSKKTGGAVEAVAERTMHDRVALGLALLPLLLWFMTLITAPLTLIFVFYAWKRPLSIVRPGRWRFVAAGVIASLQICGWGFLGVKLWLS